MISGSKPKGFTIVETMIFLAVSGAILVSAMALISGSQNKAQFKVAMNDAQQEITKVINNVVNGYYPSTATQTCSANGNALKFSGGSLDKGTNKDCSFIGRVIQFTNGNTFKVYSVAGLRQTNDARKNEVSNMTEAKATALPSPQIIDLKNGLTVKSVKDAGTSIGAVGFFTGFGTTDPKYGLLSGSLQAEFIGIENSSIVSPSAPLDVADIIKNPASNFRTAYATKKNPSSGIVVCFQSGTTNQHGTITIGGQNKAATTTLVIEEGPCS